MLDKRDALRPGYYDRRIAEIEGDRDLSLHHSSGHADVVALTGYIDWLRRRREKAVLMYGAHVS